MKADAAFARQSVKPAGSTHAGKEKAISYLMAFDKNKIGSGIKWPPKK